MPIYRTQQPSPSGFPSGGAQRHGSEAHRPGIRGTDSESPPEPAQKEAQQKSTVGQNPMPRPQGPQESVQHPQCRTHPKSNGEPDRAGLRCGHPSRRLSQPPLREFS